MKEIGGFAFPETKEEADQWHETQSVQPLHRRVMAFAHTRVEGAWAAYIFPVPGLRHSDEWLFWMNDGEKLPECIAVAIFPHYAGVPYAG